MPANTPLTLLGGLTAAQFLADYWQKRPLLIRGALPDFATPLSPDELAGLACEEGVEASNRCTGVGVLNSAKEGGTPGGFRAHCFGTRTCGEAIVRCHRCPVVA